jgi:iron complex outermembrane receptor protein
MRLTHLLAGCAFAAFAAASATAQDVPPVPEGQGDASVDSTPADTPATDDQRQPQAIPETEIVVTARKREESLQDVPVAATAVTGDVMERRGLGSVRDIAALTPGLNVSGDAVSRSFVAIRGVGTTLVQTVQPGVGIFIDGVYQPNTAFLSNPLVDVERIEVLRGPQGTLYGKNTLGGAINVITRQPGNALEGRINASYAGPDDSWLGSASIGGPIIQDKLSARIAYAHREQDGFLRNNLLGIDANPLNSDSLNASIRAEPVDDVVITLSGYYDWLKGAVTPYAAQTGPKDYNRIVNFNVANLQTLKYRGIHGKIAFPISGLATDVTLVGAYDRRDTDSPASDLDFSALDFARGSGTDQAETTTAELRLDTKLGSTLSSLVGLFYSHETMAADGFTLIVPASLTLNDVSATRSNTYAAFGTLFWRPSDAWEVTAGLRVDNEKRRLTGRTGLVGLPLAAVPEARIAATEVSPRISVTRHWNSGLMSYASIARGFRGGGFNANPRAPNRAYGGDTVWTYEVGTKFTSDDRRVSLSGALFYNDYKNFIGLNSIAPLAGGGFATVDLNTGDVESYGAELEGSFRPTKAWTISGGLTLLHARITDDSAYTQLTGRLLGSDRLPFQPDWNFSLNSDYVVPVGSGKLTFSAGLVGKGDRIAASLNETFAPVLDDYLLANGQITYSVGGLEVSAFVNNAFNADYYESYIEKTTLALAGLIPTDVGIPGDQRRYGIRTRFRF